MTDALTGTLQVPRWLVVVLAGLLLTLASFVGADIYVTVHRMDTVQAAHTAKLEGMAGELAFQREMWRRLEQRLDEGRRGP